MKRIVIAVAVTIAACLHAGSVHAGHIDDPGIQQREQNQQQRIQQGVKSGELTPREAGRMESRQARITQNEERMKADGKLSRSERKKLAHEQNRASRNIYRKKHNERTVAVQ
jgi:uncharacterized protein HemX